MISTLETTVPVRPYCYRMTVHGEDLTDEFVRDLRRWRHEISTTFAPESNEHATLPPEDPLECFQPYRRISAEQREMAWSLPFLRAVHHRREPF